MNGTERAAEPIKEKISRFRLELDGRSIPMGVGCAWLEDATRDGSDAQGLLSRCYDEGFRFFDSASDYGISEDVLGGFLRGVDRKTVFLSTKSPYRGKEEGEETAFPKFRDAFFRSFDRMGVDHIDLYLVHDTNSVQICEHRVLPFLREQQEKGLIDYIGLGTRSLQAHREAICEGAVQAAEGYLSYGLLKRSASDTIRLAASHGAAWINASPLFFGLVKGSVTEETALSFSPGRLRLFRTGQKMRALCGEMGVDVVAAALQYALMDPDVDMVLNGIRRASNIDSTLRALRTPIYPDQWAKIYALQDADPCMDVEDAVRGF